MARIYSALSLIILFSLNCFAAPPKTIPPALWSDYTLNGQIPAYSWYFDDTYTAPKIYSHDLFVHYIELALRKARLYYGETDRYLYQALDELGSSLQGKEVAVIGSVFPWYECILLTYGAIPVVIEYNLITTSFPAVSYLTPNEYAANPKTFDFVLSISSTEHDGLGRYGDPLDPMGDLKSMETFKKMLNPGGKLLLAVPVGKDALVWNAHRIYGPIRLKMLLEGWKPLKYYGFTKKSLEYGHDAHHQPVILLEPSTP